MLTFLEPLDWLPTAEDLPCSDDAPVDSELQEFMSNFLKALLIDAWKDRNDWFYGVDMGVYYNPDLPPVVPDGFLSVGVDRIKGKNLRLSYVLWEEQVLPKFVLEVVSGNYRGEYNAKKDLYEGIGILYYVVYNPLRKRKPSLEVYKLIQGKYVQMVGNPIWMPELGIGIGKQQYDHQGYDREWVFWYNEQNQRYPTPQEVADQAKELARQEKARAKEEKARAKKDRLLAKQDRLLAKQAQADAAQAQTRAEQERTRAEQAQTDRAAEVLRSQRLADRLRELGVDPDQV
jgi:Uma2 family endonuclease